MSLKIPDNLELLLQELHHLDEVMIDNDISYHFLEFIKTDDGQEFCINGNVEGLIHFARIILDIVVSGKEGVHYHFDETGLADRCDMSVVICLKKPNWEQDDKPS